MLLHVPELPELPIDKKSLFKQALLLTTPPPSFELVYGNSDDEIVNMMNLTYKQIPVFPYIAYCLEMLDVKHKLPLFIQLAMDIAPRHSLLLLPDMECIEDWLHLHICNENERILFLPILRIFFDHHDIIKCLS